MAGRDQNLSNILKWGIENSNPTTDDQPAQPSRPLNSEALSALFGGPSDADLMKESMAAIQSPEVDLENKLIAFDNLEQLIESVDNANNLAPLELWTPLISLLSSEEVELRRMAAWCVGTAVQNNTSSQQKALTGGAMPVLVKMAMGKEGQADGERRKARYAISSLSRNFQPGCDEVVKYAKESGLDVGEKVDAADMDAVDALLDGLHKIEK